MVSSRDPTFRAETGPDSAETVGRRAESASPGTVVVPLAEEQLTVEKRTVETGRVRVHKTVHERSQPVDQPLYADQVEVERVRLDQVIDSPPGVRCEGDVIIVPLVEEVLVKQIVLREEIWIRRRRREISPPEAQTLRYEQAHVERLAGRGDPAGAEPGGPRAEPQDSQKKET